MRETLSDEVSVEVLFDARAKQPLQPRPPGQIHFGPEPEAAIPLNGLNAKGVDRIADVEGGGRRPSTSHADTPLKQVDEATQVPQPVARIPAMVTADPFNTSKDNFRRRFNR